MSDQRFYERPIEEGKPVPVATGAELRQMLNLAWTKTISHPHSDPSVLWLVQLVRAELSFREAQNAALNLPMVSEVEDAYSRGYAAATRNHEHSLSKANKRLVELTGARDVLLDQVERVRRLCKDYQENSVTPAGDVFASWVADAVFPQPPADQGKREVCHEYDCLNAPRGSNGVTVAHDRQPTCEVVATPNRTYSRDALHTYERDPVAAKGLWGCTARIRCSVPTPYGPQEVAVVQCGRLAEHAIHQTAAQTLINERIPPHRWVAPFSAESGMCAAMVEREGAGDTCNLDKDHPVHQVSAPGEGSR